MYYNLILIPALFALFFLSSCGRFNPLDDKIDSTSDGSYVVESSSSDQELLEKGMIVVYRFQSVQNLVAVRQNGFTTTKSLDMYSAPHIADLIQQNHKARPIPSSRSLKSITSTSSCFSAYCEARFNEANALIKNNKLNLNPVKIAVIDSGVYAATTAIKNALYSSSNVTTDNNTNNWLPHATMISSLFAGVVNPKSTSTTNIYAPNAQIHSIKITFTGDPDTSIHKQYGSLQLAVALDQAVAGGAKIINLSLTYASKPDENIAFAEEGIMAAAAQKGIIFVAAAGNDNTNMDSDPVYPAAYDMNNLIVAGSHTFNLQKASSSNYGKLVDISAQGASITVNNKSGQVSTVGGTSFAAPLVVSALSLYLGLPNNHNLTTNQILSDLFSTSSNYYQSNSGKTIASYGRLDAYNFIEAGIRASQTTYIADSSSY